MDIAGGAIWTVVQMKDFFFRYYFLHFLPSLCLSVDLQVPALLGRVLLKLFKFDTCRAITFRESRW